MNTVLLICFLVLLDLTATLTAPIGQNQPKRRRWKKPETVGEVNDYLFTYGYMQNKTNAKSDELKRSIKRFQRFNRLKVTGEMNNDTLTLMGTPRCGLPDKSEIIGRRKRYTLSGTRWYNPNLTYVIHNFTPDLPKDTTKSLIQQSLKYWSDVANISFTESKTTSGDLEFSFYTGSHTDWEAFDGPGGIVAHAFLPTIGWIHFDDDELWTEFSEGVNLRQVSAHEAGHALGLHHSTNPKAVMFPFYTGYKQDFKLDDDDIQGMQAIYGPASSTSTTTSSTSSSSSTSKTASSSSTSTSRTSSSISTSTSRTASSSSTTAPKTPSFRATPTILKSSTTTTTKISSNPSTISRRTTPKATTTRR